MATPEQIETAAQSVATELTAQGCFHHASSRIQDACEVENPLALSFSEEEHALLQRTVTQRLKEARRIAHLLPELKEARDRAINRQNAARNLTKNHLLDQAFASQQLRQTGLDATFIQHYTDRIQQNEQCLVNARREEAHYEREIIKLDAQMQQTAQSAFAAAIKGNLMDASIPVNPGLAEKAAIAATPQATPSPLLPFPSKLSRA